MRPGAVRDVPGGYFAGFGLLRGLFQYGERHFGFAHVIGGLFPRAVHLWLQRSQWHFHASTFFSPMRTLYHTDGYLSKGLDIGTTDRYIDGMNMQHGAQGRWAAKYEPVQPGRRYGRLTAVEYRGGTSYRKAWLCRCECGAEKVVRDANLKSGNTRSCGCLSIDKAVERLRRHGYASGKRKPTPEYGTWLAIRRRCSPTSTSASNNYGDRGIRVCRRWKRFELFLSDMGLRPSPKHSIDRIDNDGDYTPANCRWATRREQARNKRSNRILVHNGIAATLVEWAERTGLGRALESRLRNGWSVRDALTRPRAPLANREAHA